MAVDGDDERAKLLHLACPERLGHPEIEPVRICDLLDTRGGDDSAACGKDTMERLVGAAAAHRTVSHAALADDQPHTCLSDECFLKLLHAHAGRGADRDHLVCSLAVLSNDRPRMEDCTVLYVNGELPPLLNNAAVRRITTRR